MMVYVRIGDMEWSYEECDELFRKMADGWAGFTAYEAEAVVLARMGYMIQPGGPPYDRFLDGSGEIRNVLCALGKRIGDLEWERERKRNER